MNVVTDLLIATANDGKLAEIRPLLQGMPLRLLCLRDFPNVASVEETGATFAENASLKAAGYSSQTQQLTLAEDSGLEVAALGGAPGVLSARYCGETASYATRIRALLAELSAVRESQRTARFVSAVAIADSDGSLLNISLGMCDGQIALAPRGSGGFGYDPLFIPLGYSSTFAEMEPQIKNQISHRAHALAGARTFLLRTFLSE